MKLSKVLLSTSLCFTLFTGFSLTEVKAATNDDSTIVPLSCPEVGTYKTSYKSKTTSKKTEFTHYATNNSSTPDSVTRSVAISHVATVNIGGEATFKVLQSGAKINANVGYGCNKTKTLSTTWSVPKGTWKLTAGSSWVRSIGTRYKVAPPCKLTNATTVTANYTYATWSNKTKQ
ncbi:hypothetical protein [Bacillus massilinigeriensis]|uniref:hypothetical protein n=1 Tax=Bacillus mediterraneensis TaxID=1805474 RepID=UPI0008F85BAF|nr:hypothetical protein [Bacillus mediterraneensis]